MGLGAHCSIRETLGVSDLQVGAMEAPPPGGQEALSAFLGWVWQVFPFPPLRGEVLMWWAQNLGCVHVVLLLSAPWIFCGGVRGLGDVISEERILISRAT